MHLFIFLRKGTCLKFYAHSVHHPFPLQSHQVQSRHCMKTSPTLIGFQGRKHSDCLGFFLGFFVGVFFVVGLVFFFL